MSFGEKLKLLRFEKGLTQDDLGYILDVTKSCISCYESGTRKPSVEMLISLSIYFKVSIDYLVGIEPYNPSDDKDVRINKKDIELLKELKSKPKLYKRIVRSLPKSVSVIEKAFN